MGNRKILRGYIRVDKKGNPIPGHTVLRQKQPTGMNFKPLVDPSTYVCCDPWASAYPPAPECTIGNDYYYQEYGPLPIIEDGTLIGTDFYDNVFSDIPIGFTFNFQNVNYTEIHIGSFGQITFKVPGGYGINECCTQLPSVYDLAGGPTIVAMNAYQEYWTSDRPDAGIYTKLSGSPGSQVFSIIFKSIAYQGESAPNTYQISLYEGTNQIEMRYADLADWVFYYNGPVGVGVQGYDPTFTIPDNPIGIPFSVKLNNGLSSDLANTTLLWSASCTPFQEVDWNACQCYYITSTETSLQTYYYECGLTIYGAVYDGAFCSLADPRVAPQPNGNSTITTSEACETCEPLECNCYEIEYVGSGNVQTDYTWCDGSGGGQGQYGVSASAWKEWYCAQSMSTDNPSVKTATKLGVSTNCNTGCWQAYYPSAQLKCYKVENPVLDGSGYFRLKFVPKNPPIPEAANSQYSFAEFFYNGAPLSDFYFCAWDVNTPVITAGTGTIIDTGQACDCEVTYDFYANYIQNLSNLECPTCIPAP